MKQEILEECYREARELLRQNSTPAGILASARNAKADSRNYDSIFGRDASICALGMAASGDAGLTRTAVDGLLTLARFQAPNGQIPKFVKPERGEADFWYAGCIDATLWWLIALRFVERFAPDDLPSEELRPQVDRALTWLSCQEHQGWHLLQQGEASDWADIMPRSGFVLYTNALWLWVKRLYGLPDLESTRRNAQLIFNPFCTTVPEQKRIRLLRHYIRNSCRPSPFFLSFVNFSFWGEELDVFGNLLAFLTGLGDPSCAGKAVAGLMAMGANDPHPIRVVGTPIGQHTLLWRRYMERHGQNLAWQYHNGGAWPFVGGFWIMLLSRLGMAREARAELEKLALANRVNGWEFNEWFQGQTGQPMGMPRQSWNAALYILAYRTVLEGVRYLP